MQEALEAKKRAEEEAARVAEEERLREEEEERLAEEAAAKKAADAERRKADKLARREQLKKEGKLLTGKAKAEAERLVRVREQLLRQAGMDPDASKFSSFLSRSGGVISVGEWLTAAAAAILASL